ncbi:PilZ domain-containing protein [Xylanibacillus composti]|uniref:PilZ domain-containing protein n=1 Tax=Xylanibacillus composti TaxID=1572762 RepID=A0A8J4M3C1_9BACL|nr:PilZ domain-containing protein [Xylanibacillus composti]MDT9726480.1 PilZ domain-containing protein [Xylanibacillus composti]GIQ69950.1 hypothetical protein XYCOK13_27740 [Xylanibacillus composti]
MNTETFAEHIFRQQSNCQLIIVGKDDQGEALCYEDQFQIVESRPCQITVSLPIEDEHPLKTICTIEFVELSIRDRGVPYFAFVNVIDQACTDRTFTAMLEVPVHLHSSENRKFIRIDFPTVLPITCSIVGVRGRSTHHGVPFEADMIDVCGGGLSFLTKKRLFSPLYLKIRVDLPGFAAPFDVYGDIARISPYRQDYYRIAVTFKEVDEGLVQRIDDYCRAYRERALEGSEI